MASNGNPGYLGAIGNPPLAAGSPPCYQEARGHVCDRALRPMRAISDATTLKAIDDGAGTSLHGNLATQLVATTHWGV